MEEEMWGLPGPRSLTPWKLRDYPRVCLRQCKGREFIEETLRCFACSNHSAEWRFPARDWDREMTVLCLKWLGLLPAWRFRACPAGTGRGGGKSVRACAFRMRSRCPLQESIWWWCPCV